MTSNIRYDFGEQWDEYSKRITDDDLANAKKALAELIPPLLNPEGKSFLDIGCGSGIHTVAATRLGFSSVTATDYYDGSVRAAKSLATLYGAKIDVFQDDILNTKINGTFDVVYSWGVLHHTGNMVGAIHKAKALVAPNGLFIISIYLRTPLCKFWKIEKQVYTRLPRAVQSVMDYAFRGLAIALKAVDERMEKARGMDWRVGCRDWLGGYPYESATPSEVVASVGDGFSLVASYHTKAGHGILGTRCAEYVYKRMY